MWESDGSERPGFTLLETLLGLTLLSTVMLVGMAAGARALRALEYARILDDACVLAEELLLDPAGLQGPGSRLQAPEAGSPKPVARSPSSHTLRWRLERSEREIAPELSLEEVMLVIEQHKPEGRTVCTLSLLLRAPSGTGQRGSR